VRRLLFLYKKRKTGRDYRFPQSKAVNEQLTLLPILHPLFLADVDVFAVILEKVVIQND
jgi:hypothetical protein